MIAASEAIQRPAGARLLVADPDGNLRHAPRSAWVEFLRAGDLVVANDAATLPASLAAIHLRSGEPVEVRLAGRRSIDAPGVGEFAAVVFGAGDFRLRTEDRPAPPPLLVGDRLAMGPLTGRIASLLGHPRLVLLEFENSADEVWAGLARHGKPIQYAHVPSPLKLWDVWTPIAGAPAAFEPPSAGFAIDWRTLQQLHDRGIGFATLTHAAGISSTGDADLDRRFPLDEAYRIPGTTAAAIEAARRRGGRIVAVGTTVVRALEHAGRSGHVRAGDGVATGRISGGTRLRVADVLLSGTHEPGSSHYELLGAFVAEEVLRRITQELEAHGYHTHEFGDSVLISGGRREESTAIDSVTSRGLSTFV